MGRKKPTARLSGFPDNFPSCHMAQLASLGSSGGAAKAARPIWLLVIPPKPLPHLPISSSPLSLSPQSAQLSSWLFTPYDVLTVTGSFTKSFTSFTNVLFGNIGQEAQGREPDHIQWLQQRRIYK